MLRLDSTSCIQFKFCKRKLLFLPRMFVKTEHKHHWWTGGVATGQYTGRHKKITVSTSIFVELMRSLIKRVKLAAAYRSVG